MKKSAVFTWYKGFKEDLEGDGRSQRMKTQRTSENVEKVL